MLNSLINNNFEKKNIVFVFQNMSYSPQDIDDKVSIFRVNNSNLYNQDVIVQTDNQEDIIFLLVSLIGFASKVILLPEDLTEEYLTGVKKISGCETIFSKFSSIETNCVPIKKSYNVINSLIVLATSGTTGVPKLIEHDINSLTNTANKKITGNSYTWGQVYRVNRFAGLQVFLQAIISGNKLVVATGDYSVEQDVLLFINENVNSVSATPTYWRKLLMCEGSNSLKLSNITLGGELSNQSILNALSSIYTDAKIRHIYASTEVGVGFSVTDALEGFPTSLLVDSGMDFKLKISSEGELLIKKDILSQSFIDITKYTENEYFCTGDLVELIGERVYFRGRKSGLINVGGIKVTPEKIENVLLSMPEISDAKVYAVESSMMGNLVGAQIIKVDDNLNAKKIKEFCNTKLPKQEVPVMIKFVTHFKLTNTGKIERS